MAYFLIYFASSNESDIHVGSVCRGVNSIVSSRIERLQVNVNNLDDSSICSSVDFATNEAYFEVPMTLNAKHVSNINITAQQNRCRGLQQKEAVTLLLRLTKGSAKFYDTRKIAQRARSQEISTETFRDVSKYFKEYRFDEKLRLHAYHESPFSRCLETSAVNAPACTLCPSTLCKTRPAVPQGIAVTVFWNLMVCRQRQKEITVTIGRWIFPRMRDWNG